MTHFRAGHFTFHISKRHAQEWDPRDLRPLWPLKLSSFEICTARATFFFKLQQLCSMCGIGALPTSPPPPHTRTSRYTNIRLEPGHSLYLSIISTADFNQSANCPCDDRRSQDVRMTTASLKGRQRPAQNVCSVASLTSRRDVAL